MGDKIQMWSHEICQTVDVFEVARGVKSNAEMTFSQEMKFQKNPETVGSVWAQKKDEFDREYAITIKNTQK